jgi:hypothetical protein
MEGSCCASASAPNVRHALFETRETSVRNTVLRLLVLLFFSIQLVPFGAAAECSSPAHQGAPHHRAAVAVQQSHHSSSGMAGCVTFSCTASGPMLTESATQSRQPPAAHPLAVSTPALPKSVRPSTPVPPPIV